jgi:hypothetical protein
LDCDICARAVVENPAAAPANPANATRLLILIFLLLFNAALPTFYQISFCARREAP